MNPKTMVFRFFIVLLFSISCEDGENEVNQLQEEISAVTAEFAPDKRVALFAINAKKYNDKYILKGETNLPQAVEALRIKLKSKNVDFIDSIQVLQILWEKPRESLKFP